MSENERQAGCNGQFLQKNQSDDLRRRNAMKPALRLRHNGQPPEVKLRIFCGALLPDSDVRYYREAHLTALPARLNCHHGQRDSRRKGAYNP